MTSGIIVPVDREGMEDAHSEAKRPVIPIQAGH
jgi:hypothetical protein